MRDSSLALAEAWYVTIAKRKVVNVGAMDLRLDIGQDCASFIWQALARMIETASLLMVKLSCESCHRVRQLKC